jgi:D-glycero-alpha-D-manno-heptose-7-phosphate kinase
VNSQSRYVVTPDAFACLPIWRWKRSAFLLPESGRGAALSFATDRATFVTVKRHTEFFDDKFRLNYVVSETVDTIAEIKNNIARETLLYLGNEGRLYISTISDLPSGNGLGSSSSFCVGLLNALHMFADQSISLLDLAEKACHIEIERVGSPIANRTSTHARLEGL